MRAAKTPSNPPKYNDSLIQAVKRAAKEDGQLTQALTAENIVAAIARQKKVALDSKLINLEQAISSTGTFTVPLAITLGDGQQASLQLIVS